MFVDTHTHKFDREELYLREFSVQDVCKNSVARDVTIR